MRRTSIIIALAGGTHQYHAREEVEGIMKLFSIYNLKRCHLGGVFIGGVLGWEVKTRQGGCGK